MDYRLGPGPLQVDQNTIDEKIKGDIGIVENGDVATHAIPNGYYVIWKGDLYVAKTNISSGTTLSAESNGNLTAKTQGIGADVASAIKSIVVTERIYNFKFTSIFNAHAGASITSLGGQVLTPNIPDGYTFIGNVNVAANGIVGVSASFDGGGQHTSQSVNPYLFNASNTSYAAGATCEIHMYSICCKT